ncbi:hypothetical protein IU11_14050 [Cellulosimicrobium sp. MM]|nr:hypothetical protein [Cellulosimicrobium sp. MM]KFD43159.1 hypothetical protein IU11_14050 [Cellulosimicrobium sp. MM]
MFDGVCDTVGAALAQLHGKVRREEVTVRDEDGSRLVRDTTEEAIRAAQENDLRIQTVSSGFWLVRPGQDNPYVSDAELVVWYQEYNPDKPSILVEVKTTKRVYLHGITAAVETYRAKALADVAQWQEEREREASLRKAMGLSGSRSQLPSASMGGEVIQRTDGWWKRTWRDHAVALAVTIGGTVIAALIIAALKISGA